jgi:hypothetical protein
MGLCKHRCRQRFGQETCLTWVTKYAEVASCACESLDRVVCVCVCMCAVLLPKSVTERF